MSEVHPTGRWLPVPGYEGRYDVSDAGLVRSRPRLDTRGNRLPGKTLRPGKAGPGYPTVALCDGRQRTWNVHDLVTAAFIGPKPAGCEVNHKDGDKWNNAVANLEYVTRGENIRHAFATGLSERGERHYRSRLTADDVREIRSLRGVSRQKDLAARYDVARTTIAGIQQDRWWKHI